MRKLRLLPQRVRGALLQSVVVASVTPMLQACASELAVVGAELRICPRWGLKRARLLSTAAATPLFPAVCTSTRWRGQCRQRQVVTSDAIANDADRTHLQTNVLLKRGFRRGTGRQWAVTQLGTIWLAMSEMTRRCLVSAPVPLGFVIGS